MAARLQLCSLAILPSHTPCQLLRAYQHKTVLDLIFQIHSVVMRISRCRPWLTCWRCAHSLRHRIARRSARLLDRFKRLLYLRRLHYLRRLLYLRRLKYLQRLLCLRKLLYLHRQAILDLQASQQESIKARLDCAILALQNEQSRWTDLTIKALDQAPRNKILDQAPRNIIMKVKSS